MVCCLAFLLGSFPSGVVLGRLTTGRDVRTFGSGNIGAANVARVAGFKVGAGVALIDILKGLVPVLIGRWTGLGPAALAAAAAAAVLGHDFSIFLQFRGGKGVATTLGVMLALVPLATIFAMVCWLIVLGLRGYSSLASLVALGLLPIFVGVTGQEPVYVVLASALFFLSAGKHWENIIRLMRGTEPAIRWRKRADGG